MWLPRRRSRLAALVIGALLLAGLPLSVRADVPTPGGGESVVNVKVGGDRVGVQSVTPLAGVTLGLFSTEEGGSQFQTCVSDGDGDCNFIVQGTGLGQPNRDLRFWVRQVDAPGGWFTNPALRTGSSSASGTERTPYSFQTPRLEGGRTYRSGFEFMSGTGSNDRKVSGGVWQQSRNNPVAPTGCGLDVALILDLSGSVGTALPDLQQAADTFTDALVGTPSRMSLFSFSDNSPAEGATRNYPELTSVSTTAGAEEFKDRYDDWTVGGGTNWDRGIAVAGAATDTFDVAVMITDGNPTVEDDPPTGPRSFNRLKEVEAGIFSANQLKQQGTRMLTFGVGAGAAGPITALNLRAISGPVAFDGTNGDVADYFQTTDYAAVGTALRNLALGNCAGSISVTKQIVPSGNTGEDVSNAVPAGAGWVFNATSTTAGLVDPPPTRATTGDGTGTVNYPLIFPGGVNSAPVTVVETQQSGYTLVTQGGQNAVCRNLTTGTPVPVTNDDTDPAQPGFTVGAPRTDAVNCTIYNRAPIPRANIIVEKEWVINGVEYDNGDQPDEFQTELTLTGPGAAGATEQNWGVARDGYSIDDDVTMDETDPTLPSDLCEVDTARVTEINGDPAEEDLPYTTTLEESANTYTITNVVTCRAELTLLKEVLNGTREPTDWTLTATGPPSALPGPTGQSGTPQTTDVPVTPDVNYQLSEDEPDPNYAQVDLRSLESRAENPTSTGSMLCREISRTREQVLGFLDGLDGGVQVPLGGRVECIAANVTAVLELRKLVENNSGGSADPADWTLTATPIGNNVPDGVVAQSVTGNTEFQGLNVRPGVTYRITETGPPNYTGELSCEIDEGPARSADTIVLEPLDLGQCTFTNRDDPAQLTLVKTVDNGNTGATTPATDWILSADGPTDISGATGTPFVTDAPVSAGSYTLDETGPAGYTESTWTCEGGEITGDTVVVPFAGDVTCAITNTARQPQLTLAKVVDPVGLDAGYTPADWELTASGPLDVTGPGNSPAVTDRPVQVGTYDLSESGPPGFDASEWVCTGGADATATSVTLDVGSDATCTITNSAEPSTLTLVKTVTNDNGGTADPTDWTLTADGPTPGISGVTGAGPVTNVPVDVGEYTLSESGGPTGYTAGEWSCVGAEEFIGSDVTIDVGENVTCTINNNDQPAQVGRWTIRKASDPASGSTVDPGAVITYTATASKLDGVDPRNVVVVDDLSDVLNNASFVDGSISASTGSASLSGDELTWTIPQLSGDATVSYQVRVDDDAYNVTLRNVISSTGSSACGTAESVARPPIDPCPTTTTHHTPGKPPKPPKPPIPPVPPNPPNPPLPPTGGPGLLPLGLGLALLVGGLTLALVSRRGARRSR